MAKKQKSFAEKASSKGEGKDLVHVKYVKSVKSDKEGFWRFNESMIAMEKGQNLDVALKELEDAENLVDIVMPGSDEALAEEKAKLAEEAPADEPKEDAPAEEEDKEGHANRGGHGGECRPREGPGVTAGRAGPRRPASTSPELP